MSRVAGFLCALALLLLSQQALAQVDVTVAVQTVNGFEGTEFQPGDTIRVRVFWSVVNPTEEDESAVVSWSFTDKDGTTLTDNFFVVQVGAEGTASGNFNSEYVVPAGYADDTINFDTRIDGMGGAYGSEEECAIFELAPPPAM